MFQNETREFSTLTIKHFFRLDGAGYSWSLNGANDDNDAQTPMIVTDANQSLPTTALAVANQLKSALIKDKNAKKSIRKIVISSPNRHDESDKISTGKMIFLCGLLICKLKPTDIQWGKLT